MFQVHPDDDTQDLDTAHPVVIISGNIINGHFTVSAEKELLFRCNDFITTIAMLLSFYYTLNIEYPSSAINTLKFLQFSCLEIKGGYVPQKVQTLMNKIKKNLINS